MTDRGGRPALARAGSALRRRWHRLHAQPERGYSLLAATIALPVVFGLLMFIVQWAIVWHANHLVQAAAQEGLRTAEAYRSTAKAGHDDAVSFLTQTAPHALGDVTVKVHRSATTVTVHVHATVESAVPLGRYTVKASAVGPVEAFVAAP